MHDLNLVFLFFPGQILRKTNLSGKFQDVGTTNFMLIEEQKNVRKFNIIILSFPSQQVEYFPFLPFLSQQLNRD